MALLPGKYYENVRRNTAFSMGLGFFDNWPMFTGVAHRQERW